ncbi:MAG: hypothetical protein L6Q76_33385, partial [Polyangiaceae bacterium]|nr:hypothetical protein [Polyangiaceae bacterium]
MESIRTLDKSAILATLVRRMEQRTGAMRARTADTAYQASLQEDRMKTRYDTMRIEGSWLADGMNRVAGEMAAQLTRAKHYEFRAPA